MSQQTRIAVDTLYFGLKIKDSELSELYFVIKKNLYFFDECEIRQYFCRNRFYESEFVKADKGFFLFQYPKKNVQNDFVTIQLTGKFFQSSIGQKFVKEILEFYKERFVFQRLDICCDVLYNSVDDVPMCKKTNTLGFPFPEYELNWRWRKVTFNTYGRIFGDTYCINMVSQGKNDIVFRVYDKNLDLLEKYKENYSQYYFYKENFPLAYRIELQLRGDKLKKFVENCLENGYNFYDYSEMILCVLSYLGNKYRFFNFEVPFLFNIDSFSGANNKSSSDENKLNYYRKMQFSFFRKYCDKLDEIRFNKLMENQLNNYLKTNKTEICFNHPDLRNVENFRQGFMDFQKEYLNQISEADKVPF